MQMSHSSAALLEESIVAAMNETDGVHRDGSHVNDALADGASTGRIIALLQQLIMCAENDAQALSMGSTGSITSPVSTGMSAGTLMHAPIADQDILFDAEVDGVRCLLLRSSSTSGDPTEPVKPEPQPDSELRHLLSPREQEIARMIAKGYPNKTIAAVLEISPWTVGTHLRRIFAKLNVPSRAAMVARVMDAGLLAEGPAWAKGLGELPQN
jgi:DNA-binding CsgD family transcriptional regulator